MKEDNKAFSFSYSGATIDELEQFKEKYSSVEPEEKIKRIRALDKRVDFIATMISITLGIIGTGFLISGVIQIITIEARLVLGIIQTAIGLFISAAVPFLYAKIHKAVKKLYSPQILTLIEEIEKNQI